eukprot:gene10638-3261_t
MSELNCSYCEFSAKSKRGLSIHITKKHKTEKLKENEKPTEIEFKKNETEQLSEISKEADTSEQNENIDFTNKILFVNLLHCCENNFNLTYNEHQKKHNRQRDKSQNVISKIVLLLNEKYKFKKMFIFGKNLKQKSRKYNPVQFSNINNLYEHIEKNQKSGQVMLISDHFFDHVQTVSGEQFLSKAFQVISPHEENLKSWFKKLDKKKVKKVEENLEFEGGCVEKNETYNNVAFKTVLPEKEDDEEFEVNFRKAMEKKKKFQKRTKELMLGTGQFDEIDDLVQKLKTKKQKLE